MVYKDPLLTYLLVSVPSIWPEGKSRKIDQQWPATFYLTSSLNPSKDGVIFYGKFEIKSPGLLDRSVFLFSRVFLKKSPMMIHDELFSQKMSERHIFCWLLLLLDLSSIAGNFLKNDLPIHWLVLHLHRSIILACPSAVDIHHITMYIHFLIPDYRLAASCIIGFLFAIPLWAMW